MPSSEDKSLCFGDRISKWADQDRYKEFSACSCRMLLHRSLRQRMESLWRVFLTELPPWQGWENLTLLTSPVGRISLPWPRSHESCCLSNSIIERNEITLLGSERKIPGARSCDWERGFNSQSLPILGDRGSLRCNNKDAVRAAKQNPEGNEYQQNNRGKQRQICSREISPCTFPPRSCSCEMLHECAPRS